MTVLGPLGFTAPWLLLGLLALPVLWFLLRAVPPAPVRRRFPGVALLLGLADEEAQAERTPWWLLLLRMAALAAVILGFAGPVLNPAVEAAPGGRLLIVEDGSWASARDWPARAERMERALTEAAAAGRPAAVLILTDPPGGAPAFTDAGDLAAQLPGLAPKPWEPGAAAPPPPEGAFETLWLSDGLAREGREALARALLARGALHVWQPEAPVLALGRARVEGAEVVVPLKASAAPLTPLDLRAVGPDPAGVERELARLSLAPGEAEARFDLPPELRNRVARFEIAGLRSAGAVSLTDDAVKRRKVALVGAGPAREGLALLDPLHYLREALAPSADLLEGALEDMLAAKPDVIVLADSAPGPAADRLAEWVEEGGLLLRFAGPRMAAEDAAADPLLPVRIRAGGRTVGGAMSWGAPRKLAPFAPGSLFAGLAVPEEVEVRAQLMAEPGPELAERSLASLADGTPLITRAAFGTGEIVLFHVTANAEWSSLPLSGLFPQMLARLAISARGAAAPGGSELAGRVWQPLRLVDAFGQVSGAEAAAGVAGEDLAEALSAGPGAATPPGIYAAEGRAVALNAVPEGRALAPATWPAGAQREVASALAPMPLKGAALGLGLGLLLLDILAAMAVSGRLRGPRGAALGLLLLALWPVLWPVPGARAEDAMPEERAIAAASNVVLAAMPSGDAEVDRIALAGLRGLSDTLAMRTTVEPSEPMQIDLARDDLALFSLIYWPVTAGQPAPSPEGYAKLNRYLRGGGMILFDTRDADLAEMSATPAGQRLQALAAPLDIPPLEPIPPDHILTRTFYLLQTFPGRYDGSIWVEAAPPEAAAAEGMPFRQLNDGVTPVVIGGNDWAAAWAQDARGMPMFPVGRGLSGERQREVALRFGVNLVMHVLTGNYKSDQVHVPALLERLGQ
ncbi:LytTR family transcriptional regulator [Rhodobacter xanthinilyticus]|uniref:LytTR family transcriptional regulator n=1 Tax=Rhodobacter xanthinilyticus TaxID=1850250 RepID=A0A1D9MFB0_9RHOB|nr:DUF4159 domain-containing protein [Rhodobacter xanthinilyticus]AOZ70483.1 LytTR family transcriptional regulator [Rhodobacter xanthinilyticus]